jgi:hypothetical protein
MARTTKTSTTKPAVEKAEAPDLMQALLDGLKVEGVTAKPRWNPKKTYASLLVGKRNIGYAFKQSARGMRIEPAASKADCPKGAKVFKPGTRSTLFALVGTVKSEADMAEAVAILKAAAAKRAEAAKPAPAKAAPAKAAAKK